MFTDDQSLTIAFLSSPAAHAGAAVERIDTHTSIVFLAGERAWKLKRAVRFDYLDYSTAERRRAMCVAEVRVNRRTAPSLYRGVTAVTRQPDGSLAIDGSGTPIDWLVEMTRFDEGNVFNRLAAAGRLPLELMRPLGCAIARLHRTAASGMSYGGWAAMRRVIDGNAAGFGEDGAGILDAAQCARLTGFARMVLDRGDVLLEQRRADGLVRHCHGDLHLRNIVLLGNEPTLFDAIEFNDDLAWIDVLYDLAFLLMDLWQLGLPRHANAVWNGYLAETSDFDGVALLPLFLSCRAAVMAKTAATTAKLQTDPGRRLQLRARANAYLALADAVLEPPPARVIAIGGLSGSGKSTLATALAPSLGAVPGAVIIRSDEIRKKLCGRQPLDHLGPEGYTEEMSRRVYATLMAQTDKVVRGGYVAIADAVFSDPADREAIARVARAAGAPFVGLWLEAPEPVLLERVEHRGPDASDARGDVVRRQLARPLARLRWHRLDATRTCKQVGEAAGAIAGGQDRI